MSWEAWGTPPTPEPQVCPLCGEQSHSECCELGAMQKRALDAESEMETLRALHRQVKFVLACCMPMTKQQSEVWHELVRLSVLADRKTPNVGIEPPKVGSNDGLGPL